MGSRGFHATLIVCIAVKEPEQGTLLSFWGVAGKKERLLSFIGENFHDFHRGTGYALVPLSPATVQ